MSVKILKHGDLRPRHFICDVCKCEFVADLAEYKWFEYGISFEVSCPECRREVVVKAEKAPLYKEKEGRIFAPRRDWDDCEWMNDD